mmetsp:Transcript_25935/g.76722  ORF Transcript_25935/g.76722 Transcript_25935/m.76722 type:complete len:275 (-) Transcript_25935:677-1501(-)
MPPLNDGRRFSPGGLLSHGGGGAPSDVGVDVGVGASGRCSRPPFLPTILVARRGGRGGGGGGGRFVRGPLRDGGLRCGAQAGPPIRRVRVSRRPARIFGPLHRGPGGRRHNGRRGSVCGCGGRRGGLLLRAFGGLGRRAKRGFLGRRSRRRLPSLDFSPVALRRRWERRAVPVAPPVDPLFPLLLVVVVTEEAPPQAAPPVAVTVVRARPRCRKVLVLRRDQDGIGRDLGQALGSHGRVGSSDEGRYRSGPSGERGDGAVGRPGGGRRRGGERR